MPLYSITKTSSTANGKTDEIFVLCKKSNLHVKARTIPASNNVLLKLFLISNYFRPLWYLDTQNEREIVKEQRDTI